MIKKLILLVIVGMLVLSGVQAIKIPKNETETMKILKKVTFSGQPIIEEKDNYLSVELEDVDASLMETGKPMLPVYFTNFEFSKNVKIKGISCDYADFKEKSISGKIIPSPEPSPHSYPSEGNAKQVYIEDKEVYESDLLYPSSWYDYRIRCGLNNDGISTTFVTVELHPVRYSPQQNMLYYTTDFEISIHYDDPLVTTSSNADYDLVIIAPSEFTTELQPLVDHKISHNVNTILKTTEDIYAEYQGRDKPEQIKYFIKDAKETWDITYVLLVGGLKSFLFNEDRDDTSQGSTDWHIPVRYANIRQSDEKSCISDLYYSDLYRYNETTQSWEFEDWDSNGDGIFAKMTFSVTGRDTLDLAPDVYYGRLACRSKSGVETMVNKIITYESTPPEEKTWFKKMIGVGGQTFGFYEGQPDGEYSCDRAIGFMGDLIDKTVRVYASNEGTGEPTIPDDVIPEISKGAGYVIFQGHGNPVAWNTHPVDTTDEWMGATTVYKFLQFSNKEKLPVIIVGGCHNALFNISILNVILNSKNIHNKYWTDSPSPVCFSWALCAIPWGGAIASTGCTGYGFGNPVTFSAALESGFFYAIGQDGATTLGAAHSGSIRNYLLENSPTQDPAFAITIWQLFGDPSLQLGGFPQ